ncbi:MAG: hypothetical protein IK121_05285, partial [Lachnospiraceae bacterium]|nr:hypothetical protein [Lachnospiraceae bacterium]
MKKGNTIRLFIKEKSQNGIVLYYNKKKEDVFLPIDEIRKADYKNAIPGGYLDVRVVSSRPKLLVSGKFVHPNET